MAIWHLNTPLTEDDVRQLSVGDLVYISGQIFTCRSMFHKRALEQHILPPVDFQNVNVMIHAGPVMRRDPWEVVTLAPTTSIRMEKYTPSIIKQLGVRAIIGKATMGKGTLQALQDYGCVHLTVVGTPSALLPTKVTNIIGMYGVEELGITEGTWVFAVEEFGPFMVGMDSKGHNLFEQLQPLVEHKLNLAYKQLGIPSDYTYSDN